MLSVPQALLAQGTHRSLARPILHVQTLPLYPWLYYSACWAWHNTSPIAGTIPAVGNSRWDTVVIWSRLPSDEMWQREYTYTSRILNTWQTTAIPSSFLSVRHFADQHNFRIWSFYVIIKFDVRLIASRIIFNNYHR